MKFVLATFVVIALALPAGCAPPAPTLTPAANQAFVNMEIAKALDTIRDIAQAGATAVPPVLSVQAASAVTNWHTDALKILDARALGWQAAVTAGLDALPLNPADRATLAPYVVLAKTLIQTVNP